MNCLKFKGHADDAYPQGLDRDSTLLLDLGAVLHVQMLRHAIRIFVLEAPVSEPPGPVLPRRAPLSSAYTYKA